MAKKQITFIVKEAVVCPVCAEKIYQEKMFTGRGRLNVGKLMIDLRREYIPTKEFGEVYPLVYSIMVCPKCKCAAFPSDFDSMSKEQIPKDDIRSYYDLVENLLGEELDFKAPRTLLSGLASYLLAVKNYEFLTKEVSPTFKKGLCSLRAAWLCNTLEKANPDDEYAYLANVLYRKSLFFYQQTVNNEFSGKESVSSVSMCGPDTDKDYGYDGILYLYGYLLYKYGQRQKKLERMSELEKARRIIGEVFGFGNFTKDKPRVLLDQARVLYEQINDELKELS